jgi:hypothetical protein
MTTGQTRSKPFNMSGVLRHRDHRLDRQGRPLASATLYRAGKPPLPLVAFGDAAEALAAFDDGARVKLFGGFKTDSWTDPTTGQTRRGQSFVVWRASAPDAARTQRLSVDDAYARLQQAQAIYEIDPGAVTAQRDLANARRALDRALG